MAIKDKSDEAAKASDPKDEAPVATKPADNMYLRINVRHESKRYSAGDPINASDPNFDALLAQGFFTT